MEDRLAEVDALLLDMDGTLADSDAAVERAWATWAREHGVSLEEVDLHGRDAVGTVRLLRPDLSDEDVAAAAAHQHALQYDDLDDIVRTPGTDELLAVISDLALAWAVVTSADRRLAAARLGVIGIEPPVLVTTDDLRIGKPDPEGYLRAARTLGVPPGRCLVVEDSRAGLEAGRAAGALTCGLKALDSDVSVADLGELARLLTEAVGGAT